MKAYRAGGGGSCPGCSPGPPFEGAPLNAPLLPTPASSASKRAISAARSAIAAAPVLLQGRQGKAEAGKEWLRWCGSQWGRGASWWGRKGGAAAREACCSTIAIQSPLRCALSRLKCAQNSCPSSRHARDYEREYVRGIYRLTSAVAACCSGRLVLCRFAPWQGVAGSQQAL